MRNVVIPEVYQDYREAEFPMVPCTGLKRP